MIKARTESRYACKVRCHVAISVKYVGNLTRECDRVNRIESAYFVQGGGYWPGCGATGISGGHVPFLGGGAPGHARSNVARIMKL